MDDSSDGAGDGAWLTYAEMANQCGISLRAAVRRTQRQRLRRQPGNDGKVRVLVPRDMLEPSQRASQDKVRSDRAGDARDALRTAIEALKGENAAQTSLIAELRIGLEQARAESQEAREALAELRRADDARKALGRWARLRRAWRGE
jgi:hypothetical protein